MFRLTVLLWVFAKVFTKKTNATSLLRYKNLYHEIHHRMKLNTKL